MPTLLRAVSAQPSVPSLAALQSSVSTTAMTAAAPQLGAGRGDSFGDLPTIGASSTATLRPNATGPQVVELQELLTRLGYDVGKADGKYGNATRQAVAAFQTAEGLTADGTVGPRTWAALRAKVEDQAPALPPQPQVRPPMLRPEPQRPAVSLRPEPIPEPDFLDAGSEIPSSGSRGEAAEAATRRADAVRARIERGQIERTSNPPSAPGSSIRFDNDADGLFIGAGSTVYGNNALLGAIPAFGDGDRVTVMLNGINTDIAKHSRQLEALAAATGTRVVGLHNGKEGSNVVSSWWGGIQQVMQDKNARTPEEFLKNPSTANLVLTMLSEFSNGRPMNLMGHSHGALIIANAVKVVNAIVDGSYAGAAYPYTLRQKISRALQATRVETFGGAADNYPVGPSYVHYINTKDKISKPVGLDSGPASTLAERAGGPKATVVHFSEGGLISMHPTGHHLEDNYLKRRLDFEDVKARAGGSPTLSL